MLKLNFVRLKRLKALILVFIIACSSSAVAADLKTRSANGKIDVTSWKALRDFRVVKQEFDNSCGAASLATLLNGFYGHNYSEKDVLNKIQSDGVANFENLAHVAGVLGYKSGGVIISFDELSKLSVPAIAYLNYRGQDHFTVISGVSKAGNVRVADPSWGNRKFRPHQFKKMWETVHESGKPKGKILLIVPRDVSNSSMDHSFFNGDVNFRQLTQFIPLSPN